MFVICTTGIVLVSGAAALAIDSARRIGCELARLIGQDGR